MKNPSANLSSLAALCVLTLGLLSHGVARAACVTPPAGLVSCWRAEGNASDSVGGNNGTSTGGIAYAGGEVGQAFLFNGSTSYIPVPASPGLNIGAGSGMTIECWVQPHAQINLGDPIVEWDSANNDGLQFWVETSFQLYANIKDTSNNNHQISSANGIISTNVLQHVALTYDKGSGAAVLYLNGTVVATNNFGAITPQTTYPMNIGRRTGQPIGNGDNFNGLMDELSLYSRALLQGEIAAIYNAGSAGKCDPAPGTITAYIVPSGTIGNQTLPVSQTQAMGNDFDVVSPIQITSLGVFDSGGDGLVGTLVARIYDRDTLTSVASLVFSSADPGTLVGGSRFKNLPAPLTLPAGFHGACSVAYLGTTTLEPDGNLREGSGNWTTDSGGGLISFVGMGRHSLMGTGDAYPDIVDPAPAPNNFAAGTFVFSPANDAPPPTLTSVAVGPVTNSANGHVYYLLSSSTWTEAEAKAVALGGHLATINDAAEQVWVFNTFGISGGTTNHLWIGLTDQAVEGSFVWISGETASYRFWGLGQPDNGGGAEDYVHINSPADSAQGLWNDYANLSNDGYGHPFRGVVEMPSAPQPSNPIVAIGPVTNSANGHVYYLLSSSTWTEAEAKAVALGGHLATINDAAEQVWVFNTFGISGGTTNHLWIGLTDQAVEGSFVWISGETASYRFWGLGQPDNGGGIEDYVHINSPADSAQGLWNDYANLNNDGQGHPFRGVVEIPSALPPSNPIVPQIVSFTPALGANGTVVTLTGTNFSPVAANNTVYFGAVRATVNASSATSLTVTVPAGATYAPPTVSVGGLLGAANAPFTPTFAGGGMISSASFAPRFSLATGTSPQGTVIADFDGDGKPDLAVTDYDSHSISVFRNVSALGTLNAASFAVRVVLPTAGTAQTPRMLVAADVDGDGKLDLVAGDHSSASILVFRNQAQPGTLTANSFAPQVTLPVAFTPGDVVVRDLDGDGRAEIVAAGFTGTKLSILPNIGSAGQLTTNSFGPRIELTTSDTTYGLTVADLDRDGRLDIATGCNNSTVSLFRNVGGGVLSSNSFAPPVSLAGPAAAHFMRSADLDGDGKPELLVTSYLGATLSVFRNLATAGTLTTGSFAARVGFALAGRGHTISLGDLNGDGKLDVVVDTEIASSIAVFQNQSTLGSFTSASFAPRVDLATGYNAWGSSVGDLDGDGRPDILFANAYDNTISICKNLGVVPPAIIQQPVSQSVVAGDLVAFSVGATGTSLSYQWRFNGNPIASATTSSLVFPSAQLTQAGNYSVVVANAADSATSSNATLTVNPRLPVPVIKAFSPAAATNGAAITLSGTNFSPVAANNTVFFGAVRAAVTAASVTNLTVTMPTGATFAPITVTVNGLTTYSPQPFLPTFLGAGGAISAASFGPRQTLASGTGPIQVVIADLDNDGKPDLIVANNYNNTISLYRNISAGATLTAAAFAAPVNLATPGGNSSPYGIAAADLDGDGKLDIIATDYVGTNVVSVYRNTCTPGNISFGARVDFATGMQPQGVAVSDIDGDGRPDLLVANVGSGKVSILRNTSVMGSLTANSFASKVDFVTGSSCANVTVGDLDGDGKSDVVTANAGGGMVTLLRNTSSPGNFTFDPKASFTVPDGAIHVKLVDLDGDGKLDVVIECYVPQIMSVFRNTSTVGSLTAASLAPRIDFALGGRGHTTAVGDLNGDGKPDLAVATELNSLLSIFRNTGTPGSFTNSSLAGRVDLATGYNAWGVTVGDLDGDGRPDVVFANSYDNNISIYQNLAPFAAAPLITLQPTNQIVTVGDAVTFNVAASGTSPLTCQWKFNGTNITDATNTALTILDAQLTDAGIYSVTVVNPYGSDASSNAVLQVNSPPVADASATTPLVISVNSSNATVVLNGSLSFDPDGDSLQYYWYQTGALNPLATGIVAVVTLPVGTNLITLLVNDGLASNQDTITVEVITLVQAVERLKDAVADVSHKQSLIASLNAALASIDRSNPTAAINQLSAFQSKVIAQISPLDPALAQSLIHAAQSIIDVISGGGVAAKKSIKALAPTNGKMHLNFSGLRHQIYIIEASTNLVEWEKIGVAQDQGDGTFDFDDASASPNPARYYRVIVP